MEKEDIVNYVMETPGNSNPAILGDMLEQLNGGGASNLITGKFTGTADDAGKVFTISLPYNGNGYPIVVLITAANGLMRDPMASMIRKNARGQFLLVKSYVEKSPTYDTSTFDLESNGAAYLTYGKTSTSSPSSWGASGSTVITAYADVTPSYTPLTDTIKIRNNKTICVRFSPAAGEVGFTPEVEYAYYVIYSE